MNIDYENIRNRYYNNGGYTEVPEIISNETKRLIKSIYEMIEKNDYLKQESGDFIENSSGTHGLQITDLLLLHLKEPYSKILNKNLVPTYSYARTYVKKSNLPKHTDRKSCQYSITLNIGGSDADPWSFWCKSLTKPDSHDVEIKNDMYVPIIYMGEDVKHWRLPLKKIHSTHIFMHYVDGDDPKYKPFWYDGRSFVGK